MAALHDTSLPRATKASSPADLSAPSAPSRLPPPQNTSFELSEANLRHFFRTGDVYVYAIDDLPRTGSENPCTQRCRWRSLGGGCNGSATALDGATLQVLVQAINQSADTNPLVKDIELDRAVQSQCSGGTSLGGARLEVDGVCWQHTHGENLNVYDFTVRRAGRRRRWGEGAEGAAGQSRAISCNLVQSRARRLTPYRPPTPRIA